MVVVKEDTLVLGRHEELFKKTVVIKSMWNNPGG